MTNSASSSQSIRSSKYKSSNIKTPLKSPPFTNEKRENKRDEDDDNNPKKPFKATTPPPPHSSLGAHVSLSKLGILIKLGFRYMLGVTVILYVLNQKHVTKIDRVSSKSCTILANISNNNIWSNWKLVY